MVLDATAKAELLENVFENSVKTSKLPDPKWPENVYVHQWADRTVSKTDIGLSWDDSDDGEANSEKLDIWFDRIEAELDAFDRSWKVGVITHKKIESQLVERIHSMGFQDIPPPMHFFNLRGSNVFQESQILVVLGCPIPNLTEFQEECEAFLYDDPSPLKFSPNNKSASLKMRDEREYGISAWGFWTPPVSDYYWQKCQAELNQAIHRIRPYRAKDYDRHIFLFTNMPVPGVLVDDVIIETDGNWLAAAALKRTAIGWRRQPKLSGVGSLKLIKFLLARLRRL